MKERIVTALGIIAVVLLAMWQGQVGLTILLSFIILIGAYEIYAIRKSVYPLWMLPIILIAVFAGGLIPTEMFLLFLALFLVLLFVIALYFGWFPFEELSFVYLMVSILVFALQSLLVTVEAGIPIFLYILVANFATDTFAYFGGYFFGKHKLNERISPKKTIEGSVIGALMSVIMSLAFAYFAVWEQFNPAVFIASSLIIPIVSQIGDLSFSLIKRHFNIKDFGNIFPGHGGVLDRIDSVIFSLIAFNVILLVLA